MEKWEVIPGFPNYEVSDQGNFRRASSGRPLKVYENQYGLPVVGFMRHGKQHHRSAALVVARHFVESPYHTFDTPITLNGDRHDLRAENIVWRPRWFARKYNAQFHHPYDFHIAFPIKDLATEELSDNSFACAIRYGLLESEVVESIQHRTYAYPTHQQFAVATY